MGLFGDFFDDPLFDLDGNGNVDALEEAIAFNWFLNCGSSVNDSGSGDTVGNDYDFDNDDLFDDEVDDFDSDCENIFDDDYDLFGGDSFDY